MAKTVTEIRSLARSYTRTALRVLVGVMRSKDATATAKVSAANAILDRGWGKGRLSTFAHFHGITSTLTSSNPR